jgi:SAM-dependent methyltransferase
MTDDLLGMAIADYYFGNNPGRLWVHDTIGPRVEMDVSVYFRDWSAMPELEKIACQECGSKVLDIGAGAGSHALELQKLGKDVTALDISPLAARVMKARGVRKVRAKNVFSYSGGPYDTLLLLMNGIGLTGNIEGLRTLLRHAKKLLWPKGQLLFDSSDVAYLYEKEPKPTDHYYGEIRCRYEYKRRKTSWFSWLYIDYDTLIRVAAQEGWRTELLFEDDSDQYLVRLRLLR